MDVIKSRSETLGFAHYHSSLTNHWGTKVDALKDPKPRCRISMRIRPYRCWA